MVGKTMNLPAISVNHVMGLDLNICGLSKLESVVEHTQEDDQMHDRCF
jgi:hypothetical protein